MTRRDISLTVALCLSLLLHALLLAGVAEVYARKAGTHILLAGFPRQPISSALLVEAPDEDPMHRLGGDKGLGESIGASPGELPLLAPHGSQNQPFLSRDPIGPGNIGDDPSDSVLPVGSGAWASVVMPQMESTAPTEVPAPFGVTSGPTASAPPKLTKQQAEAPMLARAANAPPDPSAPGAARAADPAPLGDSEIDPVATRGSAEFRRGSTDVRLGRKHRITRPHISLAGMADLLTLPSPVVVLKLTIDQTGNVTSAEVFRSSGSNDIDQPCKLAAYNWWFEPSRDKNRQAVKDVILFTIRFI